MKIRGRLLMVLLVSLGFIINVNASETLQSQIDGNRSKEIVLDRDYTEIFTVGKDQDITIDLNGHSITSTSVDTGKNAKTLEIYGKLTIKDSKDNGEIKSFGTFVVDNGTFVLDSGKLTFTKLQDYGLYAKNGGEIIINGGEITADYSVLTGNNTTGAMKFVVNGGTLTTKYGPAIYMSGPISLDITGGTLNGGISLRMGKVNISGGIINAATASLDDITDQDYYAYNGNVWLADALFVMGGTYNTDITGETNILDLNITGGIFNVTNKLGSGIAIYDIAKVAQEMKVNISGNVEIKTNSTTRGAFDVLNLDDLKITNIKSGYNNKDYVGKVSATITGGKYSSDVSKYVPTTHEVTKANGMYTVAKKEFKIEGPVIDNTPVKEIKMGIVEDTDTKNIIEDSLKDFKIDTTDKNAKVEIAINKTEESNIDNKVLTSIKDLISAKNAKIAGYFDITLNVLDSDSNEQLGTLTQLNKKIKFNVAIPEELLNIGSNIERNYYVIRYHDGKAEKLAAKIDGNILSFETDRFSTYAVAYEDVEIKTVVNPATGDDIVRYVAILMVSAASLGFLSYKLKKNN